MILEVDNILISSDILTEHFCCDLSVCHGCCCIEGDAGAPVKFEEVAPLEEAAERVWCDIAAGAQAIIDKQGVVYNDREGELVTSIVNGRNCVFTTEKEGCCLCLIQDEKPISCALYPIREKRFRNGQIGLNYDRWTICECARKKGAELQLPVYKFLRGPIIRRFGEDFYNELDNVAQQLCQVSAKP